jgi:hypothetical protein
VVLNAIKGYPEISSMLLILNKINFSPSPASVFTLCAELKLCTNMYLTPQMGAWIVSAVILRPTGAEGHMAGSQTLLPHAVLRG